MIVDALSPENEVELFKGGFGIFSTVKQLLQQTVREDLEYLTFRLPGFYQHLESVSFSKSRTLSVIEAPASHGTLLVMLSMITQALNAGRKVLFLRESSENQERRDYVMSLIAMYPENLKVISLCEEIEFGAVMIEQGSFVVVEHSSLLSPLQIKSFASILRIRSSFILFGCNSALELNRLFDVDILDLEQSQIDAFAFGMSSHSEKYILPRMPTGEFITYNVEKNIASKVLTPQL